MFWHRMEWSWESHTFDIFTIAAYERTNGCGRGRFMVMLQFRNGHYATVVGWNSNYTHHICLLYVPEGKKTMKITQKMNSVYAWMLFRFDMRHKIVKKKISAFAVCDCLRCHCAFHPSCHHWWPWRRRHYCSEKFS